MHIFLSYAKSDTHNLATELAVKLNAQQNISVWLEQQTVNEQSADLMKHEIDRCDVMVVLISPNINHAPDNPSAGVIVEIAYAQSQRKLIIPVLAQQTELPSEISPLEYIDLTQDVEQGTQRLIQHIGQLAARNDLEVLALEKVLECAHAEINRLNNLNEELSLQLKKSALNNPQEQNADSLTTRMLAGMSHELRTPLISIIGHAQILLQNVREPLTKTQEEDIRTIHNNGEHLFAIIGKLIEQAQIETGNIQTVLDYFDLSPVIDSVVNEANNLNKNPDLQILMKISDDLPLVYADKFHTEYILLQLVENAINNTSRGSVTIGVRLVSIDRYPPYVEISIEDTGGGFSPDIFENHFVSNPKIKSSLQVIIPDTFSLLILRLARLQNSKIWLEGRHGIGTTFHIMLFVNAPEDS